MPHDFPLALHSHPTSAAGKSQRALFEIAKFYAQSSL
jgi:hypothetical protein